MLKNKPRAFWMVVDIIGFIVGLFFTLLLGEYNRIDGFMLMNDFNKLFLLYFAIHMLLLAIHGLYILATTDEF